MKKIVWLIAVAGMLGGGVAQAVRPGENDIVDTVVARGNFNTLAQALKTAGLVGTLKEEGPYTFFAPTDAAFKALPPDMLNNLFTQPDHLRSLLLRHVVRDEIETDQFVAVSTVTAEAGNVLHLSSKGGRASVDGVRVSIPDLSGSNGIVHVIDRVLIERPAPPKSRKHR